MSIKAIIFDLDGTLLDTLPDLISALNETMAYFGRPLHDREFYKKAIGRGALDHVRQSLPPEEQGEGDFVQKVFEHYCMVYEESWKKTTKLFEGIKELLDLLEEQDIPKAILTNKPQLFTEQMAAVFFHPWHFKAIWGAREGLPKKPDPKVALQIIEGLGLLPHEVAMIGDSDVDILTAKGAKMFSIGVTWGLRDEAELRHHGADHIVHTPKDLRDFFKK